MTEETDLSGFRYLVMDAPMELDDMYWVCTYCGAKTKVKRKVTHLPTCPAPIVFRSLSEKPIDIKLVS